MSQVGVELDVMFTKFRSHFPSTNELCNIVDTIVNMTYTMYVYSEVGYTHLINGSTTIHFL